MGSAMFFFFTFDWRATLNMFFIQCNFKRVPTFVHHEVT